MRKCSRIVACLAGAAAILASAEIATAQQQPPIRIGVLLPVTGPFAKNGIENWEAMQIARDMINERGGINGRKIEYLQGDATSPNAAISETERLITKDGIKITTGSFASPLAIAVSQAAERHGVFHWETTGAAEIITRRGFKHTFQVGAPARKYSQAAVDFIIDDLAKRLNKPVGDLRIALLWENRAFGKSVGDGVRAYARPRNIKLVYDEGYDQFATDMTPIVQKLKDVKPDVLIAISFPNDAILFQRKAKELDFNVGAFIGVSAGYSSPDLRNSIGDVVVGMFVSDFPPKVNANVLKPEVRKVADEFYKRYEDKMKRPPAGHASAGFSAIWALFTEVLPEGQDLRAGRVARDRAQARSAGRLAGQRQRHQVHQLRLAGGSEGCRPEPAGRRSACGSGPRTATSRSSRRSLATAQPAMVPLPAWNKR